MRKTKLYQSCKKNWMRFAGFVGRVNTRIILSVLFVFVFGFVSLVSKFITIFKTKNKQSTWVTKEHKEVSVNDLMQQS